MTIAKGTDQINQVLATSTGSKQDRQIVCETLETVLRATDNFYGFRLLFCYEVPDNELPGRCLPGQDVPTDDTRREYLTSQFPDYLV